LHMIQMNIFMVLVLSSIAVHAYLMLEEKKQALRSFWVLLLLTIVILVLEIFSVVLNSSNYISFINAHKLVDTLGFVLTPLVPICVALYVYKITHQYKKINISMVLWLSVPFVIHSILSLGSCQFNWIFSISNENIYVRGPLFFVSPLTSYFYYTVNLLLLYDSRKKLTREELVSFSLLTTFPAVLSSIQLYYLIYLTIWNSVAIAVIFNYIFIVYRQIKLDPLTGLGNRIAYDEYLTNLRRKRNIVVAVVNIDLDDFKSINDLLGHHEGDKALQLFSRQLEAVFAGNGVFRMGGDEFIVLLNENDREVVETYIKILIDKVNAYNESGNLSYRIEFSYGITIYNNNYNDIQEAIQLCDKLMYEQKEKKKLLTAVL